MIEIAERIFHETRRHIFPDKVQVLSLAYSSKKVAVCAFLQDAFLHCHSAAARIAGSPSFVREESSVIAVGIFTGMARHHCETGIEPASSGYAPGALTT